MIPAIGADGSSFSLAELLASAVIPGDTHGIRYIGPGLVQTKIGAQQNLTSALALYMDFQGEFSRLSQSYGGKEGVKYVW